MSHVELRNAHVALSNLGVKGHMRECLVHVYLIAVPINGAQDRGEEGEGGNVAYRFKDMVMLHVSVAYCT